MLSRLADDPDTLKGLKRLERKLQRDRAAILTDAEVELLGGILQAEVASALPALGDRVSPGAIRDQVRWQPVRERCRQARAERRWDVKHASLATRIPMYRLRAVEEARIGSMKPDLAWRYFQALGIESWVQTWVRRNRDLAARLGLVLPPRGALRRSSLRRSG